MTEAIRSAGDNLERLEGTKQPTLAPEMAAVNSAVAFLGTDSRHLGVNKGKCMHSYFFFFLKFPWGTFLWGDDTSLFLFPDPVWVSGTAHYPGLATNLLDSCSL